MGKICPITNKGTKMAGRYSNRVRAEKFNPGGNIRRKPNLQRKKIYIPETDQTVIMDLSTKAIKTINKNGAYKTLKKANII
ncbi:MAG: bL28 family ribosomal protein [Patescibacteria group bacterium]